MTLQTEHLQSLRTHVRRCQFEHEEHSLMTFIYKSWRCSQKWVSKRNWSNIFEIWCFKY